MKIFPFFATTKNSQERPLTLVKAKVTATTPAAKAMASNEDTVDEVGNFCFEFDDGGLSPRPAPSAHRAPLPARRLGPNCWCRSQRSQTCGKLQAPDHAALCRVLTCAPRWLSSHRALASAQLGGFIDSKKDNDVRNPQFRWVRTRLDAAARFLFVHGREGDGARPISIHHDVSPGFKACPCLLAGHQIRSAVVRAPNNGMCGVEVLTEIAFGQQLLHFCNRAVEFKAWRAFQLCRAQRSREASRERRLAHGVEAVDDNEERTVERACKFH
eukprot:CAMPEP_0172588386 /NCGR_PEP_ID=MMETSP1068-20121228/7284_1 /TAXON_ID=35684 /ORGANISM="Pseudopedinella elastica, Strain CCMP716" /LENGTH=270 /DNA_ID=CAMNT_0013383685 /DNA_START=62 /DNA_END=877 /DNA_ORIENTATION=+